MIMWENVTKLVREQERLKVEEAVKCDQRLNNYLINGKLSKALKLSLKMNKPRLTKKTLHTLQKRGELEHALQRLSIDERNIRLSLSHLKYLGTNITFSGGPSAASTLRRRCIPGHTQAIIVCVLILSHLYLRSLQCHR